MLKNKKLLMIAAASLMTLTTSAFAVVNGPYVGGELGWGDTHQGNFTSPGLVSEIISGTTTILSGSSRDTGIAGRIFAGYQFTPNWAAEMGYTHFSNATANSQYSQTGFFGLPGTQTYNQHGTVTTQAVDLVAKGILPLQGGFSVYGKLGLAYLAASQTIDGTMTNTFLGSTTTSPIHTSESDHRIYPTFGAGVSYDVTQNVVADVSWNHIQTVSPFDNMQNTDLVGASLAYHFG